MNVSAYPSTGRLVTLLSSPDMWVHLFELSYFCLQDYDIFTCQKCDTFSRSSDAVFKLSTRSIKLFMHKEDFTQGTETREGVSHVLGADAR
jgi:hypothetical protein